MNSCQNLDKAGETYVLTDSITANGDCFVILADRITLDLGGHTVTGPRDAAGLCRTDPATAICTTPATPGPSASFTLATNEIATLSVFVAGSADVPLVPESNRLHLRFKTSDGVVRGSTSVAVQTQ